MIFRFGVEEPTISKGFDSLSLSLFTWIPAVKWGLLFSPWQVSATAGQPEDRPTERPTGPAGRFHANALERDERASRSSDDKGIILFTLTRQTHYFPRELYGCRCDTEKPLNNDNEGDPCSWVVSKTSLERQFCGLVFE